MLCEYFPGYEWFANNNPYTESEEQFHYIVLPNVKEEFLTVKIWHDIYCYEKNLDHIVCERDFEISQKGTKEAIQYIREKYIEFLKS